MKLPFIKSFCIDTDALIILKTFYPKKEPAFKAIWEEIEKLIKEGNMFTIKFVEEEIEKYQGKDDFLKKWVKARKKHFIVPVNGEIWEAGQKIIREHPELLDQKKLANNEPEADPFLIALAYSRGAIIITQESKTNPNKIPMIAGYYQIPCINLFEFFNEQRLEFIKK
ncbi:MAG: DUF4411 family protein [Thermodesulfovibrionales bacterium]|nr:DUF4411 family protein [Nitrospinota bacterium]MCG2710333.1 DUF4411 family protein [Thermodesulfovibrionales bacterium]